MERRHCLVAPFIPAHPPLTPLQANFLYPTTEVMLVSRLFSDSFQTLALVKHVMTLILQVFLRTGIHTVTIAVKALLTAEYCVS